MTLSAPALASLMKAKLDAQLPDTAGEENLQALAEAIVEHLKTNGVMCIDGVVYIDGVPSHSPGKHWSAAG